MAGQPRTVAPPVPTGATTFSYTLPPNVTFDVESVAVEVNAAGGDTTAELTVIDPSGAVIAAVPQSTVIASGGTGVATWALRLADKGPAASTTGLHWGTNTDSTNLGLTLNAHGAVDVEAPAHPITLNTGGVSHPGDITLESVGPDVGQKIELNSGGQVEIFAASEARLQGDTTVVYGTLSVLIESELVQTVATNIEEKLTGSADRWRVTDAGGVSLLEVVETGGLMMGGALNMQSHKVTSVTDPTSAQDAATKNYVDGVLGVSPLTTKGDIYGFSTVNARIPVGSNNTVLQADSAQTLGVKWAQVGEAQIALVDVTTDNVTSAAHGFAPKSPGASGQYLNGGATPGWSAVTDAQLSTSDITTNDVSTTKHGFTPKAPNDVQKFLRGDGTWNAATLPSGSAAVATDVIWDTKGDLAAATGADAAVAVPAGADGTTLRALASATAGLEWQLGGSVLFYDYIVSGSDKASIDTGADTPQAGIAGTSAFPSNYRVLEVWLVGRTDEAVFPSTIDVNLNNDTTAANYVRERVTGTQSTASASASSATWGLSLAGASVAAGYPGVIRLTIPLYADTTWNKMAEGVYGLQGTTSANWTTSAFSGTWLNTAAINRLAILPNTAGKKFKVGTRLLIYAR